MYTFSGVTASKGIVIGPVEQIDHGTAGLHRIVCDPFRERALYGRYTDTLDEVINATATAHSPWYALPADQKWYTRYLVSEAVVRALRACCHEYPQPSDDLRGRLAECRRLLEEE